ncbi:MAG: prepilin-type N-terminal cleavage/methylation domain-containing protein [Planctomycetota bacterium]|nr:MAG: prepilin-type N-terminal cleavage/methylation domain-containing protein [Planctomycetota bacterium]
MMRRSYPCRDSRRRGYTLLEILVASAIAVLLMSALYVAVELQLRHAQAGREVIEQSTLVRALMSRVSGDINSCIGPAMPASSSSSGQAAGTTAGAATGGTGATGSTSSSGGASGSSASGSSSGGSTSSTSSSSSSVVVNNSVQVNLIQGDAGQLTLTVSQWPRELNLSPDAAADVQPIVSDLRRITYWLAGGEGNALGLARQEMKLVTSDDASTLIPPNIPDEAAHVIAEEVKSLTFSYFDGSQWQDTWDSTQPGADGATPKGPPLAIAIVIGIPAPGAQRTNNGNLKQYRHVVAIPSANGATQPNTTTTSP